MKKHDFIMYVFFQFFWLIALAPGLVWAAEDFKRQSYTIAPEDSIRSIILTHTCVTSMQDYTHARKAFGQLNPKISYSHQLQAGATVIVPVFKKPGPDCLSFRSVQIMRVDFEARADRELVYIYLDGPILPDLFTLDDQSLTRVVCDFDGALPVPDLEREYEDLGRLVHKIRLGHEDKPFAKARIVLEVASSLAGRIESEFVEHESLFILTVIEQDSKTAP